MFLSISLFIFSLSHIASSDHHHCSETAQCQNRTITCAENEACHVSCSGNWACRRTTVECPQDAECHIKCLYNETAYHHSREYTSYLVCYNMTISAAHSSLLTINASFGNQTEDKYIRTPKETDGRRWPRAMDYSTIYCPHTQSATHHCQLSCDGDSLMRGLNINAIRGTLDLRITSTSYQYPLCLRGSTLSCDHDYGLKCSLTNQAPWGCQDIDNMKPNDICEVDAIISSTETSPDTTATEISTIVPTTSTILPTTSIITTTSSTNILRSSGASTIWIDTTLTTADEAPLKVPVRSNQLSGEIVLVVILIPLLCCACLCIGFGVFMVKKNEREDHKHSRVNGEEDGHDVEANGSAVKQMYGDEDEEEEDELSETSSDSSVKDIGVTAKMLGNNPEIYGKNRGAGVSITTHTSDIYPQRSSGSDSSSY